MFWCMYMIWKDYINLIYLPPCLSTDGKAFEIYSVILRYIAVWLLFLFICNFVLLNQQVLIPSRFQSVPPSTSDPIIRRDLKEIIRKSISLAFPEGLHSALKGSTSVSKFLSTKQCLPFSANSKTWSTEYGKRKSFTFQGFCSGHNIW